MFWAKKRHDKQRCLINERSDTHLCIINSTSNRKKAFFQYRRGKKRIRSVLIPIETMIPVSCHIFGIIIIEIQTRSHSRRRDLLINILHMPIGSYSFVNNLQFIYSNLHSSIEYRNSTFFFPSPFNTCYR